MENYNLRQKVLDKLTKLGKIYFIWNVLLLIFCEILPKSLNVGFWRSAKHLPSNPSVLEIPKTLSLKVFGNS